MKRNEQGFTLIELLVVIAIIAILISLLIPSIQDGIERAREIKCQNNLRNIAAAMINFAADHKGHLPGCYGEGPQYWQRTYMGREVNTDAGRHLYHWSRKKTGSLAEYLGGDPRQIYRCPSLKEGVVGSGEGSNGMFDYAMWNNWAGAKLSSIPRSAIVYRGSDREIKTATPLVVEEDPRYYLNRSNIEGGHSAGDRLGRWHRGGRGFYAAMDGSVQSIKSPKTLGPRAVDWEVKVGDRWYIIGRRGYPYFTLPWY